MTNTDTSSKPRREPKLSKSPIESYSPRLLELLIAAGAGKTFVFRCWTDDETPPQPDPAAPHRLLLTDAQAQRFRLLRKMQARLWSLRKLMRETKHQLAADVYRAEIYLYPPYSRKPKPGAAPRRDGGTSLLHPKAGTLEVRPRDSDFNALLDNAKVKNVDASTEKQHASVDTVDESFLDQTAIEDI